MRDFAAVLLTMLMLLLSIPALSEEAEPADPTEGARLVGMLITGEDLSVYTGGTGILPASRMQTDFETEYVFENVGGLRLICFLIPDETGDGSSIVSNVDDGISSVDLDINEDGSSVMMDAAISFVPGREDGLFFFNPILLSPSGEVFAVPGDFMAVSAADPPGASVGLTIRDERKHTENGREVTDTTTVSVRIDAVREPAEIRLLQFGENHELLKSEAFLPGGVPEQIVPSAEAEYLLVETVEKDRDGTSHIRREVFGRDTDLLNTLSCRNDGICICHYHELIWEQKAEGD